MVHFPAPQPKITPLLRYFTLLPEWLLLHLKEPPVIPNIPLINLMKKLVLITMEKLLNLIIVRPI